MKNSELLNKLADGTLFDCWVRCKDCKWHKNYDAEGTGERVVKRTECMDDYNENANFFCADGERSNNENK